MKIDSGRGQCISNITQLLDTARKDNDYSEYFRGKVAGILLSLQALGVSGLELSIDKPAETQDYQRLFWMLSRAKFIPEAMTYKDPFTQIVYNCIFIHINDNRKLCFLFGDDHNLESIVSHYDPQ